MLTEEINLIFNLIITRQSLHFIKVQAVLQEQKLISVQIELLDMKKKKVAEDI